MRDIGKNIRKLRESKGLTQDQLAEKLFVARQTVSNYETGRTRPDVDMIVSIANVLETDANSVIYGLPADDRKQNTLKIIVSISITAICTVAFCNGTAKEHRPSCMRRTMRGLPKCLLLCCAHR